MDKWLTPQLREALMRALAGALLTFAGTVGTGLEADQPLKVALLAGAVAAILYLGARAGVEGIYDSRRARVGAVKASDVSAHRRT